MKKRYLKDYISDSKITKNGRIANEVKYIGDYYEFQLEEKEYKKMRLILLGSTLLIFVLFLLAGLLNGDGSFKFYILMPYICIFLPLLFLLQGYLSTPRKRKQMEYAVYDRSYLKVKFSLVGLIAASSVTVLGDIVFIFREIKQINLTYEISFCILNLAIVIISIATLIYHNRIVCEKI